MDERIFVANAVPYYGSDDGSHNSYYSDEDNSDDEDDEFDEDDSDDEDDPPLFPLTPFDFSDGAPPSPPSFEYFEMLTVQGRLLVPPTDDEYRVYLGMFDRFCEYISENERRWRESCGP